ncbi:MAG: hypothetical protein AAF404_10265, partial [Pseudomonadota bacterium]
MADFTRSTETSTRKFEAIIEDHRKKLETTQREFDQLRSSSKLREAELEAQAAQQKNNFKESEGKYNVLLAEANRLRTLRSAADVKVTQLNKEVKSVNSLFADAQQTNKALEVKSAGYKKLELQLADSKSELGKLNEQEKALRADLAL